MANPLANTVFKMKFNGHKIKVRVLDDGERINSRCIQSSAFNYGLAGLVGRNKEREIQERNNILSSEEIIVTVWARTMGADCPVWN